MTDYDTSECQERQVNVVTAFVSNSQAAELVQPTDRPLHNPSKDAQAAAVLGVSFGDYRLDAAQGQLLAVRIGIVGSISEDFSGALHRASDLASDRRDRVDQRDQLRHVVTVGACEQDGKRNAFRIRDQMVFCPAFPAIHGAGTGTFAPPTARTCELSTTAKERSSWSSDRSRFSRARWTLSHTPAFWQALRYRQQLMPDPQPNSWGKSSQGMPVFKTNMIPVTTLRRSRGLRPGYLRRRRLGGGNNGSIISHSSSSSNGLAMFGPPCPSMTSTN